MSVNLCTAMFLMNVTSPLACFTYSPFGWQLCLLLNILSVLKTLPRWLAIELFIKPVWVINLQCTKRLFHAVIQSGLYPRTHTHYALTALPCGNVQSSEIQALAFPHSFWGGDSFCLNPSLSCWLFSYDIYCSLWKHLLEVFLAKNINSQV